MHPKSFRFTFFSALFVLALSACGFKVVGMNEINPAVKSVCITSDSKTQFRRRLMQRLRASHIAVYDEHVVGCFDLMLAKESISDVPEFGDATQARTYTAGASIKLTLKAPNGVIVLDQVFNASKSFMVSPNHAIAASDQMHTVRVKLFDDLISGFFYASNSEKVNKALMKKTK